MSKWTKKPVRIGNAASIVFSWHLWEMIEQGYQGKELLVGGPAVYANPTWIPSWMHVGHPMPFLYMHNTQATKTSTGCVRQCPFCIVHKIEGDLREIDNFNIAPIIIDNNLLACSVRHFNKVIDALKPLEWCDFNQGLDARLLTKHHANRFAELHKPIIRLALDSPKYVDAFIEAFAKLRDAGIPKSRMKVYVLIGFNDTPVDALYRLQLVRSLGLVPTPMRYQPIDAKRKNEFVANGWTHKELQRYVRYWSNFRFVGSVPFDEFEQ